MPTNRRYPVSTLAIHPPVQLSARNQGVVRGQRGGAELLRGLLQGGV
jgi:hypothetical protein